MNQEIMENIAKKLKALRVTILEQDISANDIRKSFNQLENWPKTMICLLLSETMITLNC